MKNCSNCGKELFDWAQRCDGCGCRGQMSECDMLPRKNKPQPSERQIVVDLPECPKLHGYYCSADPRNCQKKIKVGVCYSCDYAIYKAAYHRKLKIGVK